MSSPIGRTVFSTAGGCGSTTPCIILPKSWNGFQPRVSIRNLFFGAVIADVVLLLAGISPNVFVVLGPVTIAHSAFVHANLDWTFGPFKYVIATPVFHRWHHTAERGGEKNFAATFPVLDLIFGTFYMPAGEKPDRYGIADREFPTSFGAQLLRPFTQ